MLGAWAWDRRHALGMSVGDVVARLADRGVRMLDSTYRGLEAGHYRPAPDVLAAVEAVYGVAAPRVAMDTTAGNVAALEAVLARPAEAIEALTDRLAAVEDGQDLLAGLLRAALAADGAKR